MNTRDSQVRTKVKRVPTPRTYRLKNDHPSNNSEAQKSTGASHPVSRLAVAPPADPSRAAPPVRIHHHGSDANTVVTAARMLFTMSFTSLLVVVAKQETPTNYVPD
jgi:hypothetical protein